MRSLHLVFPSLLLVVYTALAATPSVAASTPSVSVQIDYDGNSSGGPIPADPTHLARAYTSADGLRTFAIVDCNTEGCSPSPASARVIASSSGQVVKLTLQDAKIYYYGDTAATIIILFQASSFGPIVGSQPIAQSKTNGARSGANITFKYSASAGDEGANPLPSLPTLPPPAPGIPGSTNPGFRVDCGPLGQPQGCRPKIVGKLELTFTRRGDFVKLIGVFSGMATIGLTVD